MTRREDLVVVEASTTVDEALELLVSHRITGLPVVDDMGRLVWCLPFPSRGIFSLWPFACKQRASNFLASIHKRTNLCRIGINMFVQCCVRVLVQVLSNHSCNGVRVLLWVLLNA
jgi:CBS-domain-containing membrane protein